MKQAQFKDKLVGSTVAELTQILQDERKNLFMVRRDAASKQLENPRRLMQTRKNIARVLTALRARELQSAKGTK